MNNSGSLSGGVLMDSDSLREALSMSVYPVALTGAGISVASGLPTFDISWKGMPLRDILTEKFFKNHPETFYDLYREILQWKNAKPNAAHKVLAAFNVSIITQNIDGLHQKAGSKNVLELHGNLRNLICETCRRIYTDNKAETEKVPHCECGNILKPDIVLYGEQVHDWKQATEEAQKCDLLMVIGTSLNAAPANMLPELAKAAGAKVLIINHDSEDIFQHIM